jgi:hypothetical protein
MSTEPQRQADQQPTDQVTCDLDQASFAEVRRLVRGMLAGRGDVAADDAVLVPHLAVAPDGPRSIAGQP